MYGYVYKTTNTINNKIYIGQHKSSKFDEEYIGSGLRLWEAIEKYGIDNFKCELIEACENREQLNSREIFYIDKYNSTDVDIGYNISAGGESWNFVNENGLGNTDEAKRNRVKTNIERYGSAYGKFNDCESHKKSVETRKKNGSYKRTPEQIEKHRQTIMSKPHKEKVYVKMSDGERYEAYMRGVQTRKKNGSYNHSKEMIDKQRRTKAINYIAKDMSFKKYGVTDYYESFIPSINEEQIKLRIQEMDENRRYRKRTSEFYP